MHPNARKIEEFYQAFQRRDAAAMGACYADDVAFSDPVFPSLRGEEARAMWRMLCERGKDLALTFDGVEADDRAGRARWVARYTFGVTGRKVENRIQAEFTFEHGKIATHRDTFSFWRWARQALGPAGLLLGWTPLIRGKVRAQAAKGLAAFREKGSADPSRGGR